MSRTTLIVWGAIVMTAAQASAQTPRDTPPPPAPQTLTLTGCVSRWDASTMGAPPAAGLGAVPLVLTNAERAVPPAPPAATPAPAAADTPGRGAHSTYLLRADAPTVRLDAFVDHKVEVTGVLAADASAATPAAATPLPRPTAAAGSDRAATPPPPVSFTVTGITTIEKVCPAK
jgi:hypothetical protein